MGNKENEIYSIELDMYSEYEDAENPTFICTSKKQFNQMMEFFFLNGYDLIIKQKREV